MVAPNPLHYAVVVGISVYPGGYTKLKGPVNDARAFADWLTDPGQGGLPAENVTLILSPGRGRMSLANATPTKALVDKALWETVKTARARLDAVPEEERSEARAITRLYLFAAGHGVMPNGGKAALLDAEAEPDRRTNLELRAYADWFEENGTFAELCVFADCCRTYEALAEAGRPSLDKAGLVGGEVYSLVGWATSAGKLSFETGTEQTEEDWRGHFSKALVTGLRGNAADPGSGYVTPASLEAYVETAVTAATAEKSRWLRQLVHMPATANSPLTFGPRRTVATAQPNQPTGLPGRDRRMVVITFPGGFTDAVELVAPHGSTMYWEPSAGPWTVWLYDGSWVVQRAGTSLDTTGLADDGCFSVVGSDHRVQL